MKKSEWIVSLFAFAVVSLLCAEFARDAVLHKYTQVSRGFSVPVGNYILFECEIDMDGDGKEDKVYIYGEKTDEKTEYAKEINAAVVYARNGFVKKTNASWLKGYFSDVEAADFTNNKNKDLLIKVFADEKNSLMTAMIIDFGHQIPQKVYSNSTGISPSFFLADGFVVNCSMANGQQFAVNLKSKKDILIKQGVFNESGKLLGKEKVYSKPFFELQAKDDDKDGVCELWGSQKVILGSSETELFTIDSMQKFINNQWHITKIEVKY